ncbi:transposase-like protein [mine drainage metagenome]|uniref:Transposase-like protein n=1 Tax=mine drainage metagenome TaxID=410659 RepID=T1AAA1_9ZZZZ
MMLHPVTWRVKNEYAEFGYNRDKKREKMQIVIGLLTDENGLSVSIEVFKGNTNDVKTFTSQIKKLASISDVNP